MILHPAPYFAFRGEVQISRKHPKFAERDLRHLTSRAIGQFGNRIRHLDQRIAAYKAQPLTNDRAHEIIIRSVAGRSRQAKSRMSSPNGVNPPTRISHPRDAWSLFNAFTEILKTVNPHTSLRRGEALHGLFDGVAGLN